MPRSPVPPDVWPWIALLRESVRSAGGQLTYPQIARAFGISDTRAKHLINGYEQYKTEDGKWRMRPRQKENHVADGVEGADEGPSR